MKHLDRFRLLGYHNTRIFQLLSTAGSVASLVAVAVPSALNSGQIAWWAIALFILAGLLAVPAVWFIFRTEHSTKVFRNDDQSAIGKYLSHWIGTGRQVVVSTRDMSWADDAGLMELLENKARANDLTVILPRAIERSDHLQGLGATIIAYGDAGPVRSTFTITNFGSQGSRVAIGWPSGNYHIIQEYAATDGHPTYYLVQQLVNLVMDRANQNG